MIEVYQSKDDGRQKEPWLEVYEEVSNNILKLLNNHLKKPITAQLIRQIEHEIEAYLNAAVYSKVPSTIPKIQFKVDMSSESMASGKLSFTFFLNDEPYDFFHYFTDYLQLYINSYF